MKNLLLAILFSATVAFAQWSAPVRLQGGIYDADRSQKTWPSINERGDTLYYAKMGANGQENICFSYLMPDDTWSAPIFMPPWVNSWDQRDISPSIGPGDSVLYYVTYERPGGYGSYDIWFTRRGPDGQWLEPENAGPNINSSGMEWGVYLSRSGRHLYFSSTRLHNGNGLEMLVSERQDSGWGPAVGLPGGRFNSIDDEENVTLPADESFLILTMWGASWSDLWISTRTDSGWPRPQLIDNLNSPLNERGASLSPDGNTVFLASARHDTTGFNSQVYVSHRMSQVAPNRQQYQDIQKSSLYPNPYHGGMLWVYNLLGQKVSPDFSFRPGFPHSLRWTTEGLPTGRYFFRLSQSGHIEVIPLTIIK
jgi:hypothetical protein